ALLAHEPLLIRDSESFGPRFRGSETNLDGRLRTLVRVSRNGDLSGRRRIGGNPCEKRKKREKPSQRALDVFDTIYEMEDGVLTRQTSHLTVA
ncbi:MAG TPA: hypothetical protein PKD64_12530, partial [Pirellulaceae bacterium]|nr:hypothetical protein [Pirellulaceae bacterium]